MGNEQHKIQITKQENCIQCGAPSRLALCDSCVTKYVARWKNEVKGLKRLLANAMDMLDEVVKIEDTEDSVCQWCHLKIKLAGHAKDCPYDQLCFKVAKYNI